MGNKTAEDLYAIILLSHLTVLPSLLFILSLLFSHLDSESAVCYGIETAVSDKQLSCNNFLKNIFTSVV